MGRYCMVPGCKSGDSRLGKQDVIVHSLPKKTSTAKLWLQAVKRTTLGNVNNAGVCSLHFVPDDYVRDMQFELTNPGKDPMTNEKRRLKGHAVPSQRVPMREAKVRPSGLLTAMKERRALVEQALAGTAPRQDTSHNRSPDDQERRFKKGFSKEAKVCSHPFTDGKELPEPTFKSKEKEGRSLKDFPNTKRTGNGDTENHGVRKPPEKTACSPLPPSLPKNSGTAIFYELTQVMELHKLGQMMERDMVNRFKILQELIEANDGPAGAADKTKSAGKPASQTSAGQTGEQADSQPGQDHPSDDTTETANDDGSREQPNSQTAEDNARDQQKQEANYRDQQKQDAESGERDALLVLRNDLLVPELRDLPALKEMLSVPATLAQATRMIFALRRDMLEFRNNVLKQALIKAKEKIDECKKPPRVDKNERLLEQLSTVFSRTQLAFIRDGGKSEPWIEEDYLQSISLRSICDQRTFEYVRNSMKIPLPSIPAVRSMACCGLMPEVSSRFQVLDEITDLSTARRANSKKRPQLESDGEDEEDAKRQNKLTIRMSQDGSGAKVVPNRKRSRVDVEAMDSPEPRGASWDSAGVETWAEHDSGEEYVGSDRDWPVSQTPRGRVRTRGGGQQQARRSKSGAERTGKRRRMTAAESVAVDVVRYSSEDEYYQYQEGDSFSHEVTSGISQRRDFLGHQQEPREWGDVLSPPQLGIWETQPRRSPKKKSVKGRSPRRDRMMRC